MTPEKTVFWGGSFPYVCPEPVLVKRSHLWINGCCTRSGSIDYYNQVTNITDGGDLLKTQEWFRFFMAPGVAHCGMDTNPYFEALVAWVVRKRILCTIFSISMLNMIILPRQARDKHRESTQKTMRFLTGEGHCTRDDHAQDFGERTSFLRHFILKTEHLPRQARDKHRESTQKRGLFSQANVTRPLCLHPLVAKYTGSGSTGDPTNFECAANPVGPDTEGETAAKAVRRYRYRYRCCRVSHLWLGFVKGRGYHDELETNRTGKEEVLSSLRKRTDCDARVNQRLFGAPFVPSSPCPGCP
jgi:hypothetical protein|eukprot:COSAG06_NODE_2190_length_7381_cov_3.312277_2_plen_300_part_00